MHLLFSTSVHTITLLVSMSRHHIMAMYYKRTYLLLIGALALLSTIPALWAGLHLAAATGSFMLFPLPVLVCVGIMCIALHKYES